MTVSTGITWYDGSFNGVYSVEKPPPANASFEVKAMFASSLWASEREILAVRQILMEAYPRSTPVYIERLALRGLVLAKHK